MNRPDAWIRLVERQIEEFAERHRYTYSRTKRELSAAFEIGCFHALIAFYEARCGAAAIEPMQLSQENEYKYLTSPQGNPENYSFVCISHEGAAFQLRQQIRIRSHHHTDIAFTPDLAVLHPHAELQAFKDDDYARGRMRFFCVDSADVVSAHECKSLDPFPELLVPAFDSRRLTRGPFKASNWRRC